jgi:hypothetical protein
MSTKHIQYKMKPIETIFWLGTACVLYMGANNIVKNVAKDVAKDVFKETAKHHSYRRRCICW